MKPEEFKQNVKDRVRVFEDGGIRLLKKGKRGIIRAIFGRTGLVLALFFVQVLLLFSVFRWFTALVPHLLGGSIAFTAVMVIYLLNSDMDNSAKITWLVVIALVPVLGVVLFWWTKGEVGHRMLKRRLKQLEQDTREQLPQDAQTLERLKAQELGAASLACYLRGKGGGFPVYENTAVTYFPSGEAKFAELLCQLEKAKQYIFLEYFIIDEGLMWGRVLEVLARKAAEGVHVRVMYDGTCEFTTLPRDYPKRLERLGIACKVFSPLMPFVSTHYNYRDHRKVLVIDGKVGFTGGVNLADEYINHVEKFGRWKDAAVMLEGEAVRSLTAIFLQMWDIAQEPEFEAYLKQPIPAPAGQGLCGPLRRLPAGRGTGGRVGLYRPAQPGPEVHSHYDTLPDSGRGAGNSPQVRGGAGRGCPPHPAGQAGQAHSVRAGQDPLCGPHPLGRQNFGVGAGLCSRQGGQGHCAVALKTKRPPAVTMPRAFLHW